MALLEKHPKFSAVQYRVLSESQELTSKLTADEKEPGRPARLGALIRLLNIRASGYLELVSDLDAQKAYMTVLSAFADDAWQAFTGFPTWLTPALTEDENANEIRKRIAFFTTEGYRLLSENDAAPGSNDASAAAEPSSAPAVFISYSWDSEPHKRWVLELAKRLRRDGIDAIIDQTHMHLGGESPHFMERSITESRYVLVICTKKYKERFDGRTRGAGYEGHIITAQMVSRVGTGKFIPALRDENWETALPIALDGIFGVDLSKDSEDGYKTLLAHLHGINTVEPVGDIPKWLLNERTRKQPKDDSSAAASSAQTIDLALMWEKRNSDLVVWLKNHGLEPLEGCRLSLTNLQRFSPDHKDFQRNPFGTTLILRPQTINAGSFSSEAVPLAGFQQTTKRTLLVFRSFPHESEVILLIELLIEGGGKSRTETKFVSWKPGEDPVFVDDPRAATPEIPAATAFFSPPEYSAQRTALPESAFMKKIWPRPRWCLWSRAEDFKKARFRDLDQCSEFASSASVRSRARWTQYPWFNTGPERGEDWIASEIEVNDGTTQHFERWVLFRSGQFVHNLALDEMSPISGKTHVLEILSTVTALFEFVGRMADKKLNTGRTGICFEFHNVEGRQLTWPKDLSGLENFVDHRSAWCQDASFTIDVPYSATDLIERRREFALDAAVSIYSKFGWNDPPIDELRRMQQEKFGPPIHL